MKEISKEESDPKIPHPRMRDQRKRMPGKHPDLRDPSSEGIPEKRMQPSPFGNLRQPSSDGGLL
jgi:hypothetical protein